MPSTVVIYPVDSTDAYGKATFSGAGTSVKCRIQTRKQRSGNERNDDINENGTIIFFGNPTIAMDSRIVLPDGSEPIILSIAFHNDEFGAHHTSLTFGK